MVTPLESQRHLFDLATDMIYLNGAYMSPQLKSVTDIGVEALKLKTDPSQITVEHFYDRRVELKNQFAELVEVDSSDSISIITSASYGLANVANNIDLNTGDEILIIDEQFPSNVYPWQIAASESNAKVVTVKTPEVGIGKVWNENILKAITKRTKVVAMCIGQMVMCLI